MSANVNDSMDKSSIMDRGEKEERMVDIYITAEAVRDIKHKKQTEESNTTTQPPEHKGSERVTNRSPSSVVVCLVVLCVLLLIAVIVLCVLIYTYNHQFNINNKNITEERNQLLTNNTNITHQRDQLLTNNTKLTEERNQLLTNYTNITQERNELKVMYNNASNLSKQLNQEKTDLWTRIQEGWIYLISSEKKNWTESRKYCKEKGADLIIINYKEEQDFVQNMSRTENIWIGLSDSDKEGRWKWVDNSTMNYSSWIPNVEPNGGTKENCVVSHSQGWADYPCDFTFKWICEKNLFKAVDVIHIN